MEETKEMSTTAEEFIREKIKERLQLDPSHQLTYALNQYNINGEEALRWAQQFAITKMIEENQSILEMAKAHMDQRAVFVLQDRLAQLESTLKTIKG